MIQEAESYFAAFEQSLHSIDSTLMLCARTCSIQPFPTGSPTPKKLAYVHLYHDVKETQSWLCLILHEQHLLWNSKRQIQPQDVLDHSPTMASFLDELRTRTEKMRLYLKAVYAWLYHVYEDFKGTQFLLDSRYKALKDDLDRFCLFRHNMMTHKKMESYPLNHVMPGDEPAEFRLLMAPYGFCADVLKEFNAIYRQCFPGAQVDDNCNTNVPAAVAMLEQKRSALPRHLSRQVNTFFAKHGTCSETPASIAQFLDKLTAEAVLPLATEIKSKGQC